MGPHKTSDNSFFFRRHTIYEGSPAERMSCVVEDLNNDGVSEFVISTRNPEQLHWFGRTGSGDWEPHSLQVADFDGDARPDIYVGEMGLTDWPHAQQRIFLSRGDRMESTSSTPASERTKRRSSNWTGESE